MPKWLDHRSSPPLFSLTRSRRSVICSCAHTKAVHRNKTETKLDKKRHNLTEVSANQPELGRSDVLRQRSLFSVTVMHQDLLGVGRNILKTNQTQGVSHFRIRIKKSRASPNMRDAFFLDPEKKPQQVLFCHVQEIIASPVLFYQITGTFRNSCLLQTF